MIESIFPFILVLNALFGIMYIRAYRKGDKTENKDKLYFGVIYLLLSVFLGIVIVINYQ